MPRPGRRAFGLTLGAALLFVVGTNNQAGWLLVLSSLLLGVAGAGTVLPMLMVRRVSVERLAPPEAFQGSPVRVDLTVTNEGRRPKLSLKVRDRHLQPVTVFVPHLVPGERVILSTERTATRRGPVECDRIVASSGAPFGVAQVRRTIPAPGRTVVFPRVVPLSAMALLDGVLGLGSGRARQLHRGGGQDFFGVRDYRTGDSIRHVHWPSTARMGSLMVREFEREPVPSLGILVDTSTDAGLEDTPLDLACSIAASVALPTIALGHTVELMAAQEGRVARLRSPNRREVLTFLAELRPHGALTPAAAVREAFPYLRGCHTVLLAVPTWRTALQLPAAMQELRRSGLRFVIAAVDAGTFGSGGQVLAPSEVDALAAQLSAMDVTVWRVGAGEDLASCLKR